MISYIDEMIKSEIMRCDELAQENRRKMNGLARYKGIYLSCGVRRGTVYYSEYSKTSKKRKYLGKGDNVKVRKIQELKFREKWDGALSERIRKLERCRALLSGIEDASPEAAYESLSLNYGAIPFETIDILRDERIVKWMVEMERAKKEHPPIWSANLVHEGDDGCKYRSKSEVIEANMLRSMGVPYVSEAPLKLGEIWIHPDFTIMNPRNYRIIYAEHVGYMVNEDYRRRFIDRLFMYMSNNIVPGVNLILLFEDANGVINTPAIERQFKAILNL